MLRRTEARAFIWMKQKKNYMTLVRRERIEQKKLMANLRMSIDELYTLRAVVFVFIQIQNILNQKCEKNEILLTTCKHLNGWKWK